MAIKIPDLIGSRSSYSEMRIEELKRRVTGIPKLPKFDQLAIYVTGSCARREASEHSDIDLFFFINGRAKDLPDVRIDTMRLFSKIIETADVMRFPKFSNDGEYLKLIFLEDIIKHLGGVEDDYLNHFTARMLLLLESTPIYGDLAYDDVIKKIVDSYFRDYPDHTSTFRPIFLVNDIIRFWKTLCLNYEHKGNQPNEEPSQKLKQQVKNFKLKFSRMTTCYATVAALSCYEEPVTPEQVIALTKLPPRERLLQVSRILPEAAEKIESLLNEYSWFMEKTGLSEAGLHEYFSDNGSRDRSFERANKYGDLFYEVLQLADQRFGYMRYLVI